MYRWGEQWKEKEEIEWKEDRKRTVTYGNLWQKFGHSNYTGILKAASYKVSKCNIINSDNEIIYVYSIKW